jgi:hypothetical protein
VWVQITWCAKSKPGQATTSCKFKGRLFFPSSFSFFSLFNLLSDIDYNGERTISNQQGHGKEEGIRESCLWPFVVKVVFKKKRSPHQVWQSIKKGQAANDGLW